MSQIIPPDPLTRHIPHHRPSPILLTCPCTLQPPHLRRDPNPHAQIPRSQHDRIQISFWKESRCGTLGPVIQEDLQDATIDDTEESECLRIRIDEAVGTELVREERVVETADVTPIDPERRVPSEVKAPTNGFPCDRGEEGEVRGAGCVCNGDRGDVDGEGEGATRNRVRVVVVQGAIDEVGGVGEGSEGRVQWCEVVGVGEEGVGGSGGIC